MKTEIKRGIFLIFTGLLISCSSNPYKKTNKVYKRQVKEYAKELREFTPEKDKETDTLNYGKYAVGTTNFNLRKPNYVIIHHTAQDSVGQTLNTFTLPRAQVSSHYVISKDGEIYHMLNDYYRAWHGGVGMWGTTTDLNSTSIGIELDNNGFETFSEAQIQSLLDVLKELKTKYNIPDKNFIGHSDIAPGRKVDPNSNFPWKKLAEEGYGLWFDEEEIEKIQLEENLQNHVDYEFSDIPDFRLAFLDKILFPEVIPSGFDHKLALKVIGYDVSNLNDAVKSFKLHFVQEDYENPVLREGDLKILYNLYQKYL